MCLIRAPSVRPIFRHCPQPSNYSQGHIKIFQIRLDAFDKTHTNCLITVQQAYYNNKSIQGLHDADNLSCDFYVN